MTIAAAEFLTPDELASIRKRSDLRGIWCVAHAWGVIVATWALFIWWPNPLTLAIGIVVVGARQLGLAILMHDAAHGVLTNNKALNEALGQWFLAWPMISDLYNYRTYHLKHHRHTQQANDPDLVLSAPFPITRLSFKRKMVRDLTGQTVFKQRVAQFRNAFTAKSGKFFDGMKKGFDRLGGPIAVNFGLFVALAALGYWYVFFLLWVVPFFVWFPLITRVRNIAEHAVVPDNDDPFRNARTTKASLLWRALVAPYWVNYHVEHHLLMWVPCYNLPAFHALLIKKGFGPKMELQPDYLTVLRLATSKVTESASSNDDGDAVETRNNHGAGLAFNITPRAGKR
ncbi:MAG: fatty acid desaturase family protein [Alphaproteobacteria bacterium]|nr:fatty acid desaturase family protein [Alphaproteobacteria bacterium]